MFYLDIIFFNYLPFIVVLLVTIAASLFVHSIVYFLDKKLLIFFLPVFSVVSGWFHADKFPILKDVSIFIPREPVIGRSSGRSSDSGSSPIDFSAFKDKWALLALLIALGLAGSTILAIIKAYHEYKRAVGAARETRRRLDETESRLREAERRARETEAATRPPAYDGTKLPSYEHDEKKEE